MALLWTALSLAGAVSVFAFVLLPLLGKEPVQEAISSDMHTPEARRHTELLEQREAALSGLAELDFDRSLGNLSEDDYGHLRTQYRAQAITILQALDQDREQEQKEAHGGTAPVISRPKPTTSTTSTAATSSRQVAIPQVEGTQIGRGALRLIGGAIAVVLLAIVVGTMLLRAAGAPSAAGAPALNVLHVHAALLAPGGTAALIGHHSGLLRSEDGGRSWQPVEGITGDVLALTSSPISATPTTTTTTTTTSTTTSSASPLFLEMPDRVMQSDDAGLTWKPLPLPRTGEAVNALAMGEGNPLPLYAGVAGVGLFRTTNLRDWQLVGGGLPDNVAAMTWRPGAFPALYAAGPRDGVIATGDGGQTWGSANGSLNGVLPTLAVRSLAVDPASGDSFTMPDGKELSGAMYAGTDLGLYRSIDAGASWSPMPLREPLAAVSARSLPSPLMLAVDSRGRVWRSNDHGGTWSAEP